MWESVCEAWAEIRVSRSQQAIAQGGAAAVVTYEATLPLYDGIQSGYVLCDGAKKYKIIGFGESDRRYMTLICREVAHNAG